MINKIREIPPQKIFLIIGIIYGILFLIVTPPFQVPDEPAHFYKSYLLSQGTIAPEKVGDQNGFYLPKNVRETVIKFGYLSFNPAQKISFKKIVSLSQPFDRSDRMFLSKLATAGYPPLPYVASAVVMAFLNLFNCSVLTLMYAGRLINLLVWLTLVYLAIKITPIHKWVFTLLALMPMTLAQAASLSADSFTIAISFLTIATILKYTFQTTKIGKKQIITLLLLTITLTLSKTGYFLILLLLLIIPKDKLGGLIKKMTLIISLFLTSIITNQLWTYLLKLLTPKTTATALGTNTLSSIITDPLNFGGIFLHTLSVYSKDYVISFVGSFGWLDTPLPYDLTLVYLIVLVLVALLDKEQLKMLLKQKIIAITGFIIPFSLILVNLYTSWTPLGANVISGAQGRYFIPIAPMLFLIFYNNREKIVLKGKKINLSPNLSLFTTIVVLIFLTISIRVIALRFYF